MSNKTATSKQLDRTFLETLSLAVLMVLFSSLAPMAQATPMTVNVYGIPYFTLAAGQGEVESKHEWMVLSPTQSLEIELETDELSLQGPRDLATRDLTGQLEQFSITRMSLSLPDTDAVSSGVIDYLIGDLAGTFDIQQVVHRTPVFNAESTLSLLFWGIDYANGVGLILGLEATPTLNARAATETVNEPSLLMLLLLGCGGYLLSLNPLRFRVQRRKLFL